MNKMKLGVIGGMGPMATAFFMQKVIDLMDAKKDQDNLNMVILNDTWVPDRTDYILGKSMDSPLPYLLKDVKTLNDLGCDKICITCNTSHYFYDKLTSNSNIPIINMIDLVFEKIKENNFHKCALLATEGTIKAGVYQKYVKDGMSLVVPTNDIQEKINCFIYDRVKKNLPVTKNEFDEVINHFLDMGCDCVILGCTELSVINDSLKLSNKYIIDSMDVLAHEVIK